MSETLTATNNIVENLPYKVKDLSLADDGRKALDIAEKEMPGLMSTRNKYGPEKAIEREKINRIIAYDC